MLKDSAHARKLLLGAEKSRKGIHEKIIRRTP